MAGRLFVVSLRAFNDGAFHDEIGITSAGLPTEGTFGGYAMPARADQAADPEIDEEKSGPRRRIVAFLAPVAPLGLTKQAKDGRNCLRGSISRDATFRP